MIEFWDIIQKLPLFHDWASILATAVLLYSLFNYLKAKYQRRKLKEFWNPSGRNWTIIKPKYRNSMARVEDVLAANEIKTLLDTCQYEYRDTFDDEDFCVADYKIYLCGPKANAAAKEFVNKYRFAYEIAFDAESNVFFIEDNITGNSIYSPMDIDGDEKRSDIGIVGRVTRECNKSSDIFMFGIHGVGTYGCAKYIASKEFVEKYGSTLRNKDFIFLVKVDFKQVDEINRVSLLTNICTGSDVFVGGKE